MPIDRALSAYKEKRLNCAQSVLYAFQPRRAIAEAEIVRARSLGGGRADNGRCGALHAALHLAEDTVSRERLRTVFVESAGSEKCREIKRAGRVPCVECVRIATSLLAALDQN